MAVSSAQRKIYSTIQITQLPNEVLLGIFGCLSVQDLIRVKSVCMQFFLVARDDALYVGVLDALRVRFPIITALDDQLGTYQRALRAAKRICAYQAKAIGKKMGTGDAFVDVKDIFPNDDIMRQALAQKRDLNVHNLSYCRLTSCPTVIVQLFLRRIQASVHWQYIPMLSKDWMVLYALQRYIKRLPKVCLTKVIEELSNDEIFELVDYLYPLRVSLKIWKDAGLDLSRRRTNKDSFAHLVVRHMDFIQRRRQYHQLSHVFSPAAFIDGSKAVEKYKKHGVIQGVDKILKKRPRTLSNDLEYAAADVARLAKKFKTLELDHIPAVTKVACRCEMLTHRTEGIVNRCRHQGIHVKDPNFNQHLIKEIELDIFCRNGNIALRDLRLLKSQGQIHSVNQNGDLPIDPIIPYRERYSDSRWEILMDIFEPPLQGNLEGLSREDECSDILL